MIFIRKLNNKGSKGKEMAHLERRKKLIKEENQYDRLIE
jgi:hypothetical protein